MDVYVFTCFVNYDESEENKVGAFRIMDLPEFDLFDGVICMKNSIQYEPAVNSLIARIKKSKVPAVSVDEKVDGMYNVGISDYSSQKDIVEHLIETHDLKKINYVCGILQGKEGRERYNAYRMQWKNMASLFVIIRFITAIITGRVAGKLWSSL